MRSPVPRGISGRCCRQQRRRRTKSRRPPCAIICVALPCEQASRNSACARAEYFTSQTSARLAAGGRLFQLYAHMCRRRRRRHNSSSSQQSRLVNQADKRDTATPPRCRAKSGAQILRKLLPDYINTTPASVRTLDRIALRVSRLGAMIDRVLQLNPKNSALLLLLLFFARLSTSARKSCAQSLTSGFAMPAAAAQ